MRALVFEYKYEHRHIQPQYAVFQVSALRMGMLRPQVKSKTSGPEINPNSQNACNSHM